MLAGVMLAAMLSSALDSDIFFFLELFAADTLEDVVLILSREYCFLDLPG